MTSTGAVNGSVCILEEMMQSLLVSNLKIDAEIARALAGQVSMLVASDCASNLQYNSSGPSLISLPEVVKR